MQLFEESDVNLLKVVIIIGLEGRQKMKPLETVLLI